MGNSCSAASCGKWFKSCCSRYFCCECCPCSCCSKPKMGSTADNNVVTSNPISMGLVAAPTDETDDCKCLFRLSMSHQFHRNTSILSHSSHGNVPAIVLLLNLYYSNEFTFVFIFSRDSLSISNDQCNLSILFFDKSYSQFILCTWVGGQRSLRKSHKWITKWNQSQH